MRVVLVLIAVVVTAPAFAYDAPPVQSFAKPTADGKHVLVMLHPFERGVGIGLNKKYARSGLYPVADPTTPVWTCDWSASDRSYVFASDDGIYAVRVPDSDPGLRRWLLSTERPIPPKPAGWEDAPALLVYRNGRPVRTLALRDVFDCSEFTDRDCFMGPVVRIEEFRDDAGRVTITAEADGRKQTATVSFRTGAVTERTGTPRLDVLECPVTGPGESGWGWGRAMLIGLIVVGAGTAAFVGLAVLLVQSRRAGTG